MNLHFHIDEPTVGDKRCPMTHFLGYELVSVPACEKMVGRQETTDTSASQRNPWRGSGRIRTTILRYRVLYYYVLVIYRIIDTCRIILFRMCTES